MITVRYESQEARDVARRSGMEQGMAAGYDRLEKLLSGRTRNESASIAPPEITQTRQQIAAVIHVTIPREQMQSAMPSAINELLDVISAQGLRPAGPLFAHHLTTSPDKFDFEVGFPVDAPVKATGRVKPGELPAVRAARSVYQGGYQGLYRAWSEFGEWMKREGHSGRGDIWESYVTGPESGPDPNSWRTELYLPLKD
jgi:effector-binding domain-containing protein